MTDFETFLAGQAPDHVAIVLSERSLSSPEALDGYAESLDGGRAIVVRGTRGRSVFRRAAGEDPMAFARAASDREGWVARNLSDGDCPTADAAAHEPRLVFAFAAAESEAAGGLYAEGPVVHAYVECDCGTRYADQWVAEAP